MKKFTGYIRATKSYPAATADWNSWMARLYLAKIGQIYGWEFLCGGNVAFDWLCSYKTDRVVAYHGAQGYVGWWRGGPVINLQKDEVVSFLSGSYKTLRSI